MEPPEATRAHLGAHDPRSVQVKPMLEEITPLKLATTYVALHNSMCGALVILSMACLLWAKLHFDKTRCQALSVVILLLVGITMGMPAPLLTVWLCMEYMSPTFGSIHYHLNKCTWEPRPTKAQALSPTQAQAHVQN